MEIQFEITPQDWIDFSNYHLFKSAEAKKRNLPLFRAMIVCPALILGLAAISGNFRSMAMAFLPFIIGPPIFVGLIMGLRKTLVSLRIKKMQAQGKNRTVFGPKKMILSQENLTDIGTYAKYICDWKGIEKVVIGPEALYIYASTVSALIVPKRAFPDEAAFQAFAQTAQTYLANVSDPPPAPIAQP